MIVVQRFRGKFRQRFPEWVTSVGMLWWGLVALFIPALFNQPYFYPLNILMAQPYWGLASIFIGLAGVTSLLWSMETNCTSKSPLFSIKNWYLGHTVISFCNFAR